MVRGVIALDEIQVVLLVQHRDGEAALQVLRHGFQALLEERLLPLQKLNSHVAVCFDLGVRKMVVTL